jgi:hypothetical protein
VFTHPKPHTYPHEAEKKKIFLMFHYTLVAKLNFSSMEALVGVACRQGNNNLKKSARRRQDRRGPRSWKFPAGWTVQEALKI